MDDYRQYFKVARRNVSDKARYYLAGLVTKAPRKNMERMEEYVEDSDYQAQQQFLSDSPWSHEELDRRIGQELNELLSFPDLVELLAVYLPRADVDPEAVRRYIE